MPSGDVAMLVPSDSFRILDRYSILIHAYGLHPTVTSTPNQIRLEHMRECFEACFFIKICSNYDVRYGILEWCFLSAYIKHKYWVDVFEISYPESTQFLLTDSTK